MRRLLFPHLAVFVLGGALFRIAAVPAEVCPETTAAETRAAAAAAGRWMARNLEGDGRFLYGYEREEDRVNPGYSTVRHAGATMALYLLAAQLDPGFLDPADRALGYLLERVIDTTDGGLAIADTGDRAQLGTSGLTMAALAERRRFTNDVRYDDLMRRMGRFILGQQESSGALLAFWNPHIGSPTPDAYGPFATGEALWALGILDATFPGEGWGEAGVPTLRYLASGQRERSEGYIARLPDHWGAYALNEYPEDLLDDELVGYARRLAGYFSLRLRVEAQRRGEGINLYVRWYPGPPAGVGTAGEGMAALYRMATRDPRLADLAADMRERLACMAGLMVARQVGPDEAAGDQRPQLSEGAWFYRGYTQVDDQQHVISALLGAAEALEDQP